MFQFLWHLSILLKLAKGAGGGVGSLWWVPHTMGPFKPTTRSALGRAMFDLVQRLAYLVSNMNRAHL